MAVKTYTPKLRALVIKTQKYSTRWNDKLNANMDDPQYAALQEYIAKGQALLNLLPPVEPNP
jgi:hypothetical protein